MGLQSARKALKIYDILIPHSQYACKVFLEPTLQNFGLIEKASRLLIILELN